MALQGYCKAFEGDKTGKVTGQSMVGAYKDAIDVHEFNFSVVAPRDPASGLATGKRQWKPAQFSFVADKSLPQLAAIIDTNDTIKKMEFDFYMSHMRGDATHKGGKQILSVEYIFTTVHLASLEFRLLNTLNPDLAKYDLLVTATFVFEQIDISWKNNGNTTMHASWHEQI